MLALAAVGKDDLVVDLGCGDGRIPITAAKKYGARGIGVDIDPQRIAEANANANAAGVTHLVTFKLQDAMTTDVSQATVVTTLPAVGLEPEIAADPHPSAEAGRPHRHPQFRMGDWEAEKIETFQDKEGRSRTIYRGRRTARCDSSAWFWGSEVRDSGSDSWLLPPASCS